MNKQEFKEVMEGLKSLYGDKIPDMNGFAREVWYECLSDMDFEKAKKAIINHIKSNKFSPTVADIREQYRLIAGRSKSDAMALRDVFNEMKYYYPGGNNDVNAENVFLSVIMDLDANSRLGYANAIKNTVIDYVIRCEKGEEEMKMTLSECIKFVSNT